MFQLQKFNNIDSLYLCINCFWIRKKIKFSQDTTASILHHSGVCCKLKLFLLLLLLLSAVISPTNFSSIFVAVFFVSDSINTIKFSQTNWSRQDNYLMRSSSLKFSLISYLAKLYGLIRITSCNWRNNSSYRSKHIIYHLK